MINLFSKYYLDNTYINEMLLNAIVVFDTSALLDLYYYSSKTREEINEKVFDFLDGRLWIPAQAYFEFLKNKEKVAKKPIFTYEYLLNKDKKTGDGGHLEKIRELSKMILDTDVKKIENQVKTLKEKTINEEKHPYIDKTAYDQFDNELLQFKNQVNDFIKRTTEFSDRFEREIENRINVLETEIIEDYVHEIIKKRFQLGKEFTYQEMIDIAKEGDYRYLHEIPPGYKDNEKQGLQKYGDLFFWKQLLQHANKQRKDFILVSNDVKPDWYDSEQDAPRFELLKEFNAQANKVFWMFSMKDFLWNINSLLASKVSDEMIEEVTAVQIERQENKINKIGSDAFFDMLQEVFDSVLFEKVFLMDKILPNEALRIFNDPIIYEAENDEGKKVRVIITKIFGGNYARMLHGMTNAFEIKKYYDINREIYIYYNFIILSNKGIVQKAFENLAKTKTKKMFANRVIRTIVCCLEDNKLFVIKTNYKDNQVNGEL